MLNRFLLVIPLSIPLCGYCQGYADSPFYKRISDVPSTARVEGWAHGAIRANGIVIDLSILEPSSSPDRDEMRGPELTNTWVDRTKPEHIFHYFREYENLNAVFGYDLRIEPIQGTDQIRCMFSALTDPDELPDHSWRRKKHIPVVALPGDLGPFVIKSGDVLAITTLPLGEGRIPVVHYLRLTRTDLMPIPE